MSMEGLLKYRDSRIRNSFFIKAGKEIINNAAVKMPYREGFGYSTDKINEGNVIYTGGIMVSVNEELKMANEQVEESKQVLQGLYNDVRALNELVSPLIRSQILELRNARMSVVSEVQTMLVMMKDIRKFFLESDYKEEVERLGKFVALCKELEELKSSGIMDAVSDVMIKLSLKESEG